MTKQYEFQFRWAQPSDKTSFGFDVLASTIKEALEKANAFCDGDGVPCNDARVERVWINIARKVTDENIAAIYDFGSTNADGGNYTVESFRKELCV